MPIVQEIVYVSLFSVDNQSHICNQTEPFIHFTIFCISKHMGGSCTHYPPVILYSYLHSGVKKHHKFSNNITKVYTCVSNMSSSQIMSEQFKSPKRKGKTGK